MHPKLALEPAVQLAIFLSNKPGALARVCEALAEAEINIHALAISDTGERHLVSIANGVLLHESGVTDPATATLTITRTGLLALIGGQATAPELVGKGVLKIDGDIGALQRFTQLFEKPRDGFPLVTP